MSTIKSRLLRQFISEALSRGIIVEDNGSAKFDLGKWEKWIQNNKDEKIKGVPLKNVLTISQLLQKQDGSQSKKIIHGTNSSESLSDDLVKSVKENLFDFAEEVISIAERIAKNEINREMIGIISHKMTENDFKKLDKYLSNSYDSIIEDKPKLGKMAAIRIMNKYLDEILDDKKDFSTEEGIVVANIFDKVLIKVGKIQKSVFESRRR